MKKLHQRDFETYLSHVTGAMVIDMEGKLVYMNGQCADYLGVQIEHSLGRPIMDFFPETKMLEGLKKDKSEIVYYHTRYGLGISIHVPVYIDNEKVGLLEYDVIQASEFLYDFAEDYKMFLDEELKYLKHEIRHLRTTKYSIDNIYGESAATKRLKEEIITASKSNSTVLITGETGTGKELVAHSVHNLSKRSLREFVRINVSAVPESLFESELFGYESGAFTGASKEGKKGKFELADKGTLFIDEINQTPYNMQPKLLRVLQEQEIDRIGAVKSTPIDVRIIVATNRDLRELVNEGKFRQDLFYRLDVIEITVPPLRERLEDIPIISEKYIEVCNRILGKNITSVEPELYGQLQKYDWPGNIRELQNVIERAMNHATGTVLEVKNFMFHKNIAKAIETVEPNLYTFGENPIEDARNKVEIEVIQLALKTCNGNKSEAAKLLKISRPLLYQKMKRLKI
ncbi:MAG: sigma 54-interacting transcriptional regulator [Anaerovorax sp.]